MEQTTPTGMYTLITIFYLVSFITMNQALAKPAIEGTTISHDTFSLACNVVLLGLAVGSFIYVKIKSNNNERD
jgi:hypothetical protein